MYIVCSYDFKKLQYEKQSSIKYCKSIYKKLATGLALRKAASMPTPWRQKKYWVSVNAGKTLNLELLSETCFSGALINGLMFLYFFYLCHRTSWISIFSIIIGDVLVGLTTYTHQQVIRLSSKHLLFVLVTIVW